MKALLFVLLVSLLAAPGAGVKHDLEKRDRKDDLKDLPLMEVHAKGAGHRIFAFIVSGDGGWAKIDRELAHTLSDNGTSVVGLNSLKYF